MISINQGKLIISHMEPLILSGGFKQPITPNHCCVTDETMWRLGIQEGALDDHLGGFYDGKERDHLGRSVHVFLKDKLEKFAGVSWADYELARKRDREAFEVGG